MSLRFHQLFTIRKECTRWIFALVAGAFFSSCSLQEEQEDKVPVYTKPTPMELEVPDYFPRPFMPESNPLTQEGVQLGKILFHDPSLSSNRKVSCATCHQQELGFGDGLELSNLGVSGEMLLRHSPALINLAWVTNGLFWDGGAKNLESLAFGPLTHADEMGMSLSGLELRLTENANYPPLFEAAFSDGITAQNVAKALAQFQRTLISSNSIYDHFLKNKSEGVLTESQLKGLELVKKHCGACHKGELFTDNLFHNNGLDSDFSDLSHEMIFLGRHRVTFLEKDVGAFKTPTLRNVAVTAPFMHDGRFQSLEEVLDHYRFRVRWSPYISPLLLQNSVKAGLPISDKEKKEILEFLQALTDQEFLNKN